MNYTIQKNLESGGAGPDAYTQNGGTSVAMDTYNHRARAFLCAH